MKRVSPSVSPGAVEAPISFLSRLASRNGIADARHFCSDFGLSFRGIADGVCSDVERLAELAGVDSAPIVRDALVRVGDRKYAFGGERLPLHSTRRWAPRVCPACIRADVEAGRDPAYCAPHIRSIWQIEAARTCHVHHLVLVNPGLTHGDADRRDFGALIADLSERIDEFNAAAVGRPLSALESYLLGRVGLVERTLSESWLDGLDWHPVAKMSEVIGVVELYGRKQGLKRLTEEQVYAASLKGFEHLRRGRSGFRAFLQALFDEYPRGRRSTAEAQAVMGAALYGFLARGAPDESFDPFRDVAREFVVENFDVGNGSEVFGQRVERRLHRTIRSATLEYGVHHKRLRKLLKASGVMAPEQTSLPDGRVLMPADAVAEVIAVERDSVDLKGLEAILGVGRPHPKKLRDVGMLAPISWTGRAAQSKPRFAKAEIDRFLDRLYEGARPVLAAPTGALDPVAAARRSCRTLVEVLSLVLERRLTSVWKVSGRPGVMALAVMHDEVRGLLCSDPPEGLAPSWAMERLNTTQRVMLALIDKKVFNPVEIKNPVHGGSSKIIPMVEIEKFERSYVSLMRLAQERGKHFLKVRNELASLGIKPAWPPEKVHSRWYLRADLD